MDSPRKPSAAQAAVFLLVGGLVGFGAGYFAGGGGRPAAVPPAAAAAGDRVGELVRSLERDPENPEILTALGNAYYDREDWDHAIEAYEKARRKAPKNPNLLSDLGAAHRNRGEFDLAVAFFQKARQADPDHWQSLLNWLLVEAYDRRDPRAAQPLYDQLKRRYPDIPQIERIQEQITTLRGGSA
ncbi:MAG TPA: tetratricopeptide repeat protein [Thermoanaerobaculia bacterium]|nr:tetratricopeptide repeat protein [Thermoanaerobaculia bacterium]